MPELTPTDAPPQPSNIPFWVAAAACVIPAFAGLYWSFSPEGQGADALTRLAVLLLCGAAYLSATWLFVWPSRARAYTRPMMELPEALAKVREQLNDLNLIKKEHNRAQTHMEGVASQVNQVLRTMHAEFDQRMAVLDERQAAFDRAVADRAKADKEASDARTKEFAAVSRLQQWEKAVLDFAGLLERTSRPNPKVDAGYTAVAAEMAKDFRDSFAPFGLQLLAPQPGERFHDLAHQAEGVEESAEIASGAVVRCVGWGFVVGNEVRQKARVVVAKAARPQPAPAVTPKAAPAPAAEPPASATGVEPPAADAPALPPLPPPGEFGGVDLNDPPRVNPAPHGQSRK